MLLFLKAKAFMVGVLFCTSLLSQADSGQTLLKDVVYRLGFGHGIHQFKNYVIRGKKKHYNNAKKDFNKILESLDKLKKFTDKDKEVDMIASTVKDYLSALERVKGMVSKKVKSKKIDSSVKISDTNAVSALDTLFRSMTWSDSGKLINLLGYGGAIHNFKNFVIRGTEKHKGRSERFYSQALELSNKLGLKDVSKNIQEYKKAISMVAKMHKSGKSVSEIDKAVKISDSAAVKEITKNL